MREINIESYVSTHIGAIVTESNYLDILKIYDEVTYSHSLRVSQIVEILLEESNYSLPFYKKNEIVKAALFHDIGKLFIPKEIIQKKGLLDDNEYEIVKKHPEIGYNYCLSFFFCNKLFLSGILEHHERTDGKGYPFNLSQTISLAGRVIAIADVYDAMRSKRSYKTDYSMPEVTAFFKKNETIFDSYLLSVLYQERTLRRIETIYRKENN